MYNFVEVTMNKNKKIDLANFDFNDFKADVLSVIPPKNN
ncbi:hypothetical protein LDG_5559 [Legionella drancourtii LLAP12]|uniref:Uncharacterized protein n=1 Tax=Legionella drancourtii LLAP12 TaxID=658187 RepID=G9EK37_9GAMM|nr:hypothetical protein LDG_5559 [Legionella drancourtii LLAP12]